MTELGPSARRAMEALWAERVERARKHYSLCKERTCALERYKNDLPASDRVLAWNKAMHAERAALSEYMRTLRIFTDLVVHGTVPGQPQ